MYCGRLVEVGSVDKVFAEPSHPYTYGLLHSRPRVDRRKKELIPIRGIVPTPSEMPACCAFEPRCFNALPRCGKEVPAFATEGTSHGYACFNPLAAGEEGDGDVE